jgi:hypothetical protein
VPQIATGTQQEPVEIVLARMRSIMPPDTAHRWRC